MRYLHDIILNILIDTYSKIKSKTTESINLEKKDYIYIVQIYTK